MYIRFLYTETALRLEKVTNRVAIAFFIIIALILIKEWNRLPEFIIQVGLGVALLNLPAILAGVSLSKWCKLNIPQQICIAIEVGFQNGTLAIAIAAGLLNNPDMAVPGAIYGLFMNLTGFAIINYGRQLSAANSI